MAKPPLIIGVDAGGTKTTAWLAQLSSPAPETDVQPSMHDVIDVLGRGAAGPGNPRGIGFKAAVDAITTAIQAAYAAAALPMEPAAAACLAVAGAGRAAEQSELQKLCAGQQLAERLQIMGDVAPVLAAAYGDYPLGSLSTLRGIALISGTGSLAWGCNGLASPGRLKQARAGGWGYLLGDEGSGYWIALAALRAVCRAADGIGPSTRLLPALLQRLQLERPADLIETIYGQPFDRRRLAQLAPVVMQLADCRNATGDAVAMQIIQQAADELAALVRGVHQQLGFEVHTTIPSTLPIPPPPLALAGGVLVQGQPLRQLLENNLSPLGLRPVVVESPVVGTLYLAAALAAGVRLAVD